MDIGSSISSAITSLKAAKDVTQAMLELKTTTDIKTKVIELQEKILTAQGSALVAQSEQFELLQKLSDLERQLAALNDWKSERKRYELITIAKDVFVYALKEGAEPNQVVHWLCTNCFDQGAKSILHLAREVMTGAYYKCPRCQSEVCVPNRSSRSGGSAKMGGPVSWMVA